jgi:hypothetical protein
MGTTVQMSFPLRLLHRFQQIVIRQQLIDHPIHGSQSSATSSANNPSHKLGCWCRNLITLSLLALAQSSPAKTMF